MRELFRRTGLQGPASMSLALRLPRRCSVTGQTGDLVIIPIVDGTFSVSVVGEDHLGCTSSEDAALELALRHRRGGQIWRVESGRVVAVDCPHADLDNS
jgi:hypothetical protein